MAEFEITRKGDPDHAALASRMLVQHVGVTLERQQLFALQYTKLCNYFSLEICQSWGGNYLEHQSLEALKLGLSQFLADVNKVASPDACWINRKNTLEPWSPENLEVKTSPSEELGAPYDPYFALRGVMVKAQFAARALAIPHLELIQLKISLLVDRLVAREAILRMLRPRPLWPEVVVHAGHLTKEQAHNVRHHP